MLKFQLWMGDAGEWFWHLRSPNGRVVVTGGESFTKRGDAVRSARATLRQIAANQVEGVPEPVKR